MSDKEKKILETFAQVLPQLKEKDKDKLQWIGEGMALVTEK